jgi:hypothetical protein
MGLNMIGLRFGIGWDEDLPYSRWPSWHLGEVKTGGPDLCFAWFGLFVGFSLP